jgi:hypothetical protein
MFNAAPGFTRYSFSMTRLTSPPRPQAGCVATKNQPPRPRTVRIISSDEIMAAHFSIAEESRLLAAFSTPHSL